MSTDDPAERDGQERHGPVPDARPPIAIYRPVHYEPRYAYPLLVLLHGRGGDERQWQRSAARISRRNYIAISLRGPELVQRRRDGSFGYGWAQTWPDCREGEGIASLYRPAVPSPRQPDLADFVLETVELTKRAFHVHPGRVFLIGFGEGATAAYRLALAMPQAFAGLVAINGWLPRTGQPILRLPQARRLPVLVVHGLRNRLVPVGEAIRAYRLLYTAGLAVSLRYVNHGHRIGTATLHLINSWIMQNLPSSTARLTRLSGS